MFSNEKIISSSTKNLFFSIFGGVLRDEGRKGLSTRRVANSVLRNSYDGVIRQLLSQKDPMIVEADLPEELGAYRTFENNGVIYALGLGQAKVVRFGEIGLGIADVVVKELGVDANTKVQREIGSVRRGAVEMSSSLPNLDPLIPFVIKKNVPREMGVLLRSFVEASSNGGESKSLDALRKAGDRYVGKLGIRDRQLTDACRRVVDTFPLAVELNRSEQQGEIGRRR